MISPSPENPDKVKFSAGPRKVVSLFKSFGSETYVVRVTPFYPSTAADMLSVITKMPDSEGPYTSGRM